MTLENFGLIDNLMLDNAVSGPIELENVGVFYDQTDVYRNLRVFIRCLEQLKNNAKAA
ncbi:hypothetical protein [Vibrio chagasii]|uniref:hypothetical protein n=1 Tax=Vibrio chagasii TaxID=170679 RepID=UPI001F111318|nr:hypothetical protein [Vibrio chagasii]